MHEIKLNKMKCYIMACAVLGYMDTVQDGDEARMFRMSYLKIKSLLEEIKLTYRF